jgi:hypothetical protein
MKMFSIKFSNSNDEPIFLQIDPWAAVYVLRKGDEIEIAAECLTESQSIDIQEYKTTRILLLGDCNEYFVMKDGSWIHWSKYQTNLSD